jgi:hypothetical protein
MRNFLAICFLCLSFLGKSQSEVDTTLYVNRALPEVIVFDDKDDFALMYARAKYYVAKMYPYALLVKDLNNKFESDLAKISSNSEKKKYIKNAKRFLELEFDAIVRDMSHNEGRYLCKLVHRETDMTTYEIIQKYNGDFSAFTWQTLSRIGGANLKYKYNTKRKEDYLIELVISEVRSGKLQLNKIKAQTEVGKMTLSKRELRQKKREIRKEKKKK